MPFFSRLCVAAFVGGIVLVPSPLPSAPVTAHYVTSGPLAFAVSATHCPPMTKNGPTGTYVAGYIAGDLEGHVTGCIYSVSASSNEASSVIINLHLTTSTQSLNVVAAGPGSLALLGGNLASAFSGAYAIQSGSAADPLGGIGILSAFSTTKSLKLQMVGSLST